MLSGFLISYLLLTEQKVAGSISVAKFYGRRILRIWPLYYLLVLLTFVVLPPIALFAVPTYSALMPASVWWTLPLYALLLPHVALTLFPPVPFAEPLWSIGVEEQFYLLWPVFVKYVRPFLGGTLAIALGAVALKHALFMVAEGSSSSTSPPAPDP